MSHTSVQCWNVEWLCSYFSVAEKVLRRIEHFIYVHAHGHILVCLLILLRLCAAANPNMVEMVLLVLSSGLDHLWPCDISGGRSGSTDWDTRGAEQASENVPQGCLWIWVQLPWSCCRCSRWIRAPLLVCLCLWHQVSQLPETVIKQVLNHGLGVEAVSFWKKKRSPEETSFSMALSLLSPLLKLVTIHIISLVYKMYQNSCCISTQIYERNVYK